MKPTSSSIKFFLYSLKDFQDINVVNKVLMIINSFGLEFLPQRYDIYEPLKQKYDPNDTAGAVKLWLNEEVSRKMAEEYGETGGQVLMEKKRGYEVRYIMTWKKGNEFAFNYFVVSVDIKYFKDNKKTEHFFDLCRRLTYTLEPVYGKIVNSMFPGWTEPVNLRVRLPDIQWMTILGKPYIDLFGREKIHSAPCYSVEDLGDNMIWLQASENLFEPVPQEAKNTIKHHLGDEAFVWDGKDSRNYKSGLIPEFDFSDITLDKTKPLTEPKLLVPK